MTLDGYNGSFGILNSLVLRELSHKTLSVLCERHNGWSRSRTLGVCDNNGLAALYNGYAAVGRTQVDTNDLCHNNFLLI